MRSVILCRTIAGIFIFTCQLLITEQSHYEYLLYVALRRASVYDLYNDKIYTLLHCKIQKKGIRHLSLSLSLSLSRLIWNLKVICVLAEIVPL